MLRISFLLQMLILAFAYKANATIRIVVPGESIQAAVSASTDGDSVILDDGEYSETVILYGRNILLASRFVLDQESSHISATILSCDSILTDTSSCVVVAYDESVLAQIEGLTLSGGRGTWSSNYGSFVGGALYVTGGSLAVKHCRILDSSANLGGGVCFDGSSSSNLQYSLIMENVIVMGCDAYSSGGGMYCDSGIVSVDSCVFEDNDGGQLGGALYVRDCNANLLHTRFAQNDASNAGGIRWLNNSGNINECHFDNNGFDTTSIASHLYCSGEGTLITSCLFGPIPSGRLGLFVTAGDNESLSVFRGNVFEGMRTRTLTGSLGLFNATGEVAYNVFRNNENINGGAIYLADGASVRIHHNVFENNRSTIPTGGSVLQVAGVNSVFMKSNLFEGNHGPTLTCSIFPNGCVNTIWADSNWWGHESGPYDALRNPFGQGDTIANEDVDFDPWLTSPPDTSMPNDASSERPVITSTWRLLSLYPNPFNNEFRIEIAGFTRNDFSLSLFDLLGREVAFLHRGSMTGGRISFTAPPSLSSGVYFVKAADRFNIETKKVVLLK